MSSTPVLQAAPATITIQLPPGMDAATFGALQTFSIQISIVLAVVFGIIVWDYFVLIGDEIKLYRTMGRKIWSSPPAIAFIALRYSGIISTFPALFFTSFQTQYCQFTASLSQAGVALSIGSSGIIFAYRVSAIWGKKMVINLIVGFLYLAMLACWISVSSQYHATTGPYKKGFGTNCMIHPVPSWTPIANASSVLFDTVVLLLTMMKLNNSRSSQSRVGYVIYRDSLQYFFISTTTNIVVLIIQALPEQYRFWKGQALPFAMLMTVSMGVRVFLNLKLHNERQARAVQGLPLSQTGSANNDRSHVKYPPKSGVAIIQSVSHYPATLGPPPAHSEVFAGYNSSPKLHDDSLKPRSGHWQN